MTAPDPRPPTSQATTLSLVGRVAEQHALRERLRAALEGRGGLVLIGGEAGIGKTTLVDWLAAEASAAGAQVLTGHCYDIMPAPPYGPWHEAFAASAGTSQPHPLPDGTQPGEIASQAALFAQMRAHLERLGTEQATLLILEDLHWSDPASLDLLRDLARVLDRIGVLLLATYRVDELTRQHPLALLLPHLVREARAERLDPARFTVEDVQALLCERYRLSLPDEARLAHYLSARSGGNPFFLDELLRTLEGAQLLRLEGDRWHVGDLDQAAVPPLVRQIIEQRLMQLELETQRLLEVAAIIGQEVAVDLWQAAGDTTDNQLAQAMEEAIAAHLLLEAPGSPSVRFSHALVQETLVTRQSLLRRRATHRRVAELLAERPNPLASLIASHLASADDPRAVAWLAQAGAQALALYAARDAVAALTRAQELASRFAEPLPASAYYDRAAAYALLGEFDSARHDYELVLERARTGGDRAAEWQALIDLGVLWSGRDYERADSYYRAALDLARQIGDEPAIARSLNRIANWHVIREEPDLAVPLHQEALAIFERAGDAGGVSQTLNLLGMATYHDGRHAASVAYCERAIAHLRDASDRPTLSTCLAMLTFNGGDPNYVFPLIYREASYWMARGEEALAIARDIGWPAGEAFALLALGTITGARGDLGRALDQLRAALEVAEHVDHHERAIGNRSALGTQWYELLDSDRAVAIFEEALQASRRSGTRFWTNLVAAYLASVLINRGECERAAAVLASVAGAEGPLQSYGRRHIRFAQGELALARGDAMHALAVADELLSYQPATAEPNLQPTPSDAQRAPGLSSSHEPPIVLKLRGDALSRLEQHQAADHAYQAARDVASLFGFNPLLWRIDEARGRLYQALGRDADAAAAFASARATLDEIAASISDEPLRAQFRARAAALLPSPNLRPRILASPLSPREREVLLLIVDGCSDREIAAALSISPRTVMRHVTGILTKLDVTSRTAAATLAIRQELV
jgi:DNA-binding CsgD family transcriptional regulator/tetratricopeptide (TPR) repeat protein